jgi:hypothetical protein
MYHFNNRVTLTLLAMVVVCWATPSAAGRGRLSYGYHRLGHGYPLYRFGSPSPYCRHNLGTTHYYYGRQSWAVGSGYHGRPPSSMGHRYGSRNYHRSHSTPNHNAPSGGRRGGSYGRR